MKLKTIFLISMIFALGLVLRFLGNVPPSLNWDEASLGYNAYSILKTGKDEWGRTLPITFEAFGDYKLPGYIYTLVPFVALFDLNEFSVRLPSRLAGIFSILLIFFITRKLTGNNKIALISSFLLAISPWHLFLSRVALEANLSFFIFLLGLYFLLKGLSNKWLFALSSIFLGIAIFTYNSARLFVPLFVLGAFFIYKKEYNRKIASFYIPAALFAVFIILAGYLAVFKDSSSRYYWVSIVDQGAINYLNESRGSSPLPEVISKLIYNRFTYFGTTALSNYLTHFSPQFLFIEGGSNRQFSVPNFGLLYLFEMPFLLLGLIGIYKTKRLRNLIFLWLLLAPIPSALTRESPHVLRSVFMLGAIQIVVASGIYYFIEYIKNNCKKAYLPLFILLPAIFFISSFFYLYNYFWSYPKIYSQSWQYGYGEVYGFLDEQEFIDNGTTIYFSKIYGEPHIFYLFFTKYDPERYQSNKSLIRYSMTNWRWVDRLDNITFVNDWEVKEKLKNESKAILITSPGNYPEGKEVIKSFKFLDGGKSFDVVKL